MSSYFDEFWDDNATQKVSRRYCRLFTKWAGSLIHMLVHENEVQILRRSACKEYNAPI